MSDFNNIEQENAERQKLISVELTRGIIASGFPLPDKEIMKLKVSIFLEDLGDCGIPTKWIKRCFQVARMNNTNTSVAEVVNAWKSSVRAEYFEGKFKGERIEPKETLKLEVKPWDGKFNKMQEMQLGMILSGGKVSKENLRQSGLTERMITQAKKDRGFK